MTQKSKYTYRYETYAYRAVVFRVDLIPVSAHSDYKVKGPDIYIPHELWNFRSRVLSLPGAKVP